MKLFESLLEAATAQKKPLHAGEVMALWSVHLALAEGRVMILTFLNHTDDPEPKRFIEHYVKDFDEPWTRRFTQFMLDEGVPLPQTTPDKPKADQGSIAVGAKFTDAEVATQLASKIVAGIQIIQHGTVQCLRYDVGTMLLEIEAATFRQAFVLRQIMDRRGWLQVPPYWQVPKASP